MDLQGDRGLGWIGLMPLPISSGPNSSGWTGPSIQVDRDHGPPLDGGGAFLPRRRRRRRRRAAPRAAPLVVCR